MRDASGREPESHFNSHGSIRAILVGVVMCSCAGQVDTGVYGRSYRASVEGLEPSKNVTIYIARSDSERSSLEKEFLAKNKIWKVIGSVSLLSPHCDSSKIQELGRIKGADVAVVYVGPLDKVRRPVSYFGYSGKPLILQYNEQLQPYQVAPPQGGLMDSVIQVRDYNRRVSAENRTLQAQGSNWVQIVVLLKKIV